MRNLVIIALPVQVPIIIGAQALRASRGQAVLERLCQRD
jgi:hypothetical protein